MIDTNIADAFNTKKMQVATETIFAYKDYEYLSAYIHNINIFSKIYLIKTATSSFEIIIWNGHLNHKFLCPDKENPSTLGFVGEGHKVSKKTIYG